LNYFSWVIWIRWLQVKGKNKSGLKIATQDIQNFIYYQIFEIIIVNMIYGIRNFLLYPCEIHDIILTLFLN